jgi:DNA-binding Xre family transcriptional regulator
MTENPVTSPPARESNTVAELEHRLDEAEDAYDVLAMRLAEIEHVVNGGEWVPGAVVDRLIAGEHPVRVWREHRGLRAQELVRQADISPALLSEIENGKKEGSIRTLAALARVLHVGLDDLVPWPHDTAQ